MAEAATVSPWWFLLIAAGIVVFRTSSRLLFFYPARVQQKYLKVELLNRLEHAHPSRYQNYNAGQLYQIMHNDLNQMRGLIGFGILQIGNVIIASAVLLPKLYAFNSELLICVLPLLFSTIVFSIVSAIFIPYRKKAMDLQGEVQNFLMESFNGKKSIKNYQAENKFIHKFQQKCKSELQVFFKVSMGFAFAMPLIRLGFGASLLWGAYLVRSLDLGASSLILLSGFLFLFLEPLAYLSWIGVVIGQTAAAWKRIKGLVDFLSVSTEIEDKILRDNPPKPRGGFPIHVVMPFWNNKIGHTFERPKWSVLVGATGVGKSTLLYHAADIFRLKGFSVSVVSQEPYLYNDTIANNIFLARDIGPELIERAKELLDLFLFDLVEQEDILELEVGENGKRLSGGQSKRLALVRSLLSGADIIIWDDPFSSVDLLLERKIFEQLKSLPETKNKLMLLSSHRLSTVRYCDEILLIDKELGILETGSPQKLLGEVSKTHEYFKDQVV